MQLYYSIVFFLIYTTSNMLHANDTMCNNKYKNLVILQDILQNDPYAKVPPFISISSKRIEICIIASTPNFIDQYKAGIRRLHDTIFQRIKAFSSFGFFDYSYPTIEEIFENLSSSIHNAINFYFSFNQDEQNFFATIANNNHTVMVRSSGLEDSKTTANAGLYVSVPYVEPAEDTICMAMSNVVKSYFNPQAIKNNIAAGLDLSNMSLCIPVLIQELVGEPFGGTSVDADIPISGVAFTTNSALSCPGFPVTEINAAYGHGEGVVASHVPVDRFYVVPSRAQSGQISVYPMITYKRQRLVPTNGNERLLLTTNSINLAWQPSLSETLIHNLYTVLKKIETAYVQPMDVEFVIKNGVIYIVQARPAMRSAQTPSYIPQNAISDGDISHSFSAIPIVSGSSQVKIITRLEDIIIKDTLDQADSDERRTSAQAVLVSAWASPLSHAAVNFMGVGIPCIYLPELSSLKAIMQNISRDTPLIIDPQTNQIYLWKNIQKRPSTLISTGWYEHPIQRAFSLVNTDSYRSIRDIAVVPQDAALFTMIFNLKNAAGTPEAAALLTAIQAHIDNRLAVTQKRIQAIKGLCNEPCQKLFVQFTTQIKTVLENFKAAVDAHADRFELLFYHKMVEALLYQEPSGVLNAYTYKWFLDDLYIKQSFFKPSGDLTGLANYGYDCPTNELLDLWKDFISAASTNKNSIPQVGLGRLTQLLNTLDQVHGVPVWFATRFYHALRTYNPQQAVDIIKILSAEYDEKMHERIQLITQLQNIVDDTAQLLAQPITSLAHAEQVWQQINKICIIPLTDETFIAQFADSPLLVKLLLCTEMHRIVDRVDETIKMIKSNNNILVTDRELLFMRMLRDFFHLSKTWLTQIMSEESLVYGSPSTLNRYLEDQQELLDVIERIYIPARSDECFQKSPNFSVQAAMLGSATRFRRHYPQTPEDMFMLIHQNTLIAVSATYKSLFAGEALSDVIYIPPMMRDIEQTIPVIKNQLRGLRRITNTGIEYDAEHIQLLYNIPLNNHSATLQIVYHIATQETTIRVQFLGEARYRWQYIALLAAASPELSDLKLHGTIMLDQAAGIVSWAWLVDNKDHVMTMFKHVNYMCDIADSQTGMYRAPTFDSYEFAQLNTTTDSVHDVFERAIPSVQNRIQGRLKYGWQNEMEQANK